MAEFANAEKRTEKRRTSRRVVKIETQLSHASGSKFPVTITDLSEEGCAVSLESDVILSETDFYCIKIGGFETQATKAIWSDQKNAGLKFVSPFASYVIDHIAKSTSSSGE